MTHTQVFLTVIAVVAVVAVALLQIMAASLQRRTGFSAADNPGSGIAASDTGAAPAILLRDPSLGLRGKPDYLLRSRIDGHERLVPVEVKPTRRSRRLYDSDRVQLGAYLLALRSTAGEEAAAFGVVRYATESFHVELTAALEADVRSIVLAIRAGRALSRVHRSHDSVARCRSCAVRHACDESLAR